MPVIYAMTAGHVPAQTGCPISGAVIPQPNGGGSDWGQTSAEICGLASPAFPVWCGAALALTPV